MAKATPPKKPLKDVNSVDRAIFMRAAVLFLKFGLFVLPAFVFKFGFLLGFIYWLLCGLSLAVLVEWILDAFGSTAGRLYTGKKANWSLREKLEGELSAVRVQKMKGYHEKALTQLESILTRDPSYAEALFVKAQILHESYHDTQEALACLKSVMGLTKNDDPVHRWAQTLKKEIENQT